MQTFNDNKNIKKNIYLSLELSLVIHNLQIERGTTALYISSNGDPFVWPRLAAYYTQTDDAIKTLSAWIPLPGDDVSFKSRDHFQAYISTFRDNLDPQNVSLRQAVKFYTDINAMFIKMIAKSINIANRFEFWTELTAYQMLIISKEQAGIERAIGSTYYARGT